MMKENFAGDLHVYECRGPRFPESEPANPGFLGIWPEPPFFYLFYDRPALLSVTEWLMDNGLDWSLTHTYRLDYDQWQQISRASHQVGPFAIGTAFDRRASRKGEKIPLFIDAGVVFGSGLHESTRGCLLTIAELFERFSITSVVDLGTGTGILALACASLGAMRVRAVDCNRLAVRVARKNVLLNNQGAKIDLVVAQDLGVFGRPADLLLMNIEWPCLRRVLVEREWLNYRWSVMSGFLSSQLGEVRELIPKGCDLLIERNLGDWVTLAVESKRIHRVKSE
jgi:ribosomal protein L11 methyltransferase